MSPRCSVPAFFAIKRPTVGRPPLRRYRNLNPPMPALLIGTTDLTCAALAKPGPCPTIGGARTAARGAVMAKAVGIDLGTTNSVVAATMEGGQAEGIPNAEGGRTT